MDSFGYIGAGIRLRKNWLKEDLLKD